MMFSRRGASGIWTIRTAFRKADGERIHWRSMKTMRQSVNLEKCFAKFADLWTPKIVGELNGQQIKVARLEGDKCPWHAHENEDELFLVLEGTLDIHLREGCVALHRGEFFIVPRGVEHRVLPREPTKIVLFEPASTAHTGNVRSDITVDRCERLDP